MLLSRRFFLRSSAAAAAYVGLTPTRVFAGTGFDPGQAQPVRRGRTLVVIFLRGGMDGLNFLVPYADPAYAGLRKTLAVGRPGQPGGAVDLDGSFGLHPRAAALAPWFRRGAAVGLQAVGYDRNTRSHFEEQDTWETGVVGNTVHSDGWLNRHLLTSQGHGPIRALSIGETLPRILRGDAPAFALRGLADLSLFPENKTVPAGAPPTPVQTRFAAALEHAYEGILPSPAAAAAGAGAADYACCDPRVHAPSPQELADARHLLTQTAASTFEGLAELRTVVRQSYRPAAAYPEKNSLAEHLQLAARLIKADLGVEVIEVDYGGWDTHQNQGPGGSGDGGAYGRLVGGLADGLAAFATDLGDRLRDVLVVTLSDFGRTAAENGTGGTDHGWANCLLALGGPVEAASAGHRRPVLGRWPGLGPDQLHEKRDLLHTTDFRDVLGELVTHHLGNPQLEKVLPGHPFRPVGLI